MLPPYGHSGYQARLVDCSKILGATQSQKNSEWTSEYQNAPLSHVEYRVHLFGPALLWRQ